MKVQDDLLQAGLFAAGNSAGRGVARAQFALSDDIPVRIKPNRLVRAVTAPRSLEFSMV